MIFNVLSWLVAQALDLMGAGQRVQDVAVVVGFTLILAAAVALTWLATRAFHHRRAEVDEPDVPAGPADETREIPRFVEDRFARERSRAPRSHRAGVRHDRSQEAGPGVAVPSGYGGDETTEILFLNQVRRGAR